MILFIDDDLCRQAFGKPKIVESELEEEIIEPVVIPVEPQKPKVSSTNLYTND